MKNMLYGLLAGVLIGLLLIVLFDPHQRRNHENHDQYAWYVYAPGMVETVHFEHVFSMEKFSTNENDGLDGERQVAELFRQNEHFADYEVRLIDGHWALYRPESRETNFSMKALYRITPWMNEK